MKRRRALLFIFIVMLAVCAASGWWLRRERQQYSLNRQLIDALERGDTKSALALVNEGADPNTRYYPPPAISFKLLLGQMLHYMPLSANESPTALVMACGVVSDSATGVLIPSVALDENVPLLAAMLEHGADVNTRTFHNRTALHIAIIIGRSRTEEMLLKHGANVNVQDKWGYTPLMFAACSSPIDVVRLLLTYGANANAQSIFGDTALNWGIQSVYAESIIPELLAHGGDPNAKNKEGLTPLQLAQKANRPNLVRLLKRGTK